MKTQVRNRFMCGVGISLLALPHATVADVTAVFEVGSGENVTIEYRDDQNVRMRSTDGSYLMRQNDEVYVVSREGGDWQVLALSGFAAMMGDMASGAGQAEVASEPQEDFNFNNTGRTEVVAGIEGSVYEVVETDGWSDREVVAELVLTDHNGAVQAYHGMYSIVSAMGSMAGQQGLGDLMSTAYGGDGRAILRANDDWRLVSLDDSRIPDNYFVLPAEPTTIPGFGGSASSAAGDGQAPDVDSSASGSWLESFSRDVGQTAAEEAQQETERSVTESVTEGIRGIFGR